MKIIKATSLSRKRSEDVFTMPFPQTKTSMRAKVDGWLAVLVTGTFVSACGKKSPLGLLYHRTTPENAKLIVRHGFKDKSGFHGFEIDTPLGGVWVERPIHGLEQ